MIKDVFTDKVIYNDPPMKFEAGTPGIVQTIGFGVALEYMMSIGMDNIEVYESELTLYARQKLEGLNWLNIQGNRVRKVQSLPLPWKALLTLMTFLPS